MIYLDHHAATPLASAAASAMRTAIDVGWANPSSIHRPGRRARAILEEARRQVADALGAQPVDVVLTSGGTEAINLAILGLGRAPGCQDVATSDLEHPAVLRAVDAVVARGAALHKLAVSPAVGLCADDTLPQLPAGSMATVQWVNHETGTLAPMSQLISRLRSGGAKVFVDATQALGKVEVDVSKLGADVVAVAAHKIGGPSGAGALWVRRGVQLPPTLHGGAQERGRRPGAPDLVAHAGFGAACGELPARLAAMGGIERRRDELEAQLVERGAVVNGAVGARVATVTHVSFRGHRGDTLVAAMDLEGLCASSGAACSSGVAEPSPVIRALHPAEPWRATSALRLSLGPETTDADVVGALAIVDRVLSRSDRSPDPER